MRYILILSLIAVLGCSGRNGEAQRQQDAPDPVKKESVGASGLRLELEAIPLVVERGNTIAMVLKVVNDQAEPLTVSFSSGCKFGYGLWNADGELVAPEPPMCTMNVPIVTYRPGEEVEYPFRWEWDGQSIPPGVYELRAGIGPRGQFESASPVEIRLR